MTAATTATVAPAWRVPLRAAGFSYRPLPIALLGGVLAAWVAVQRSGVPAGAQAWLDLPRIVLGVACPLYAVLSYAGLLCRAGANLRRHGLRRAGAAVCAGDGVSSDLTPIHPALAARSTVRHWASIVRRASLVAALSLLRHAPDPAVGILPAFWLTVCLAGGYALVSTLADPRRAAYVRWYWAIATALVLPWAILAGPHQWPPLLSPPPAAETARPAAVTPR
jgi:hypothetical protein